MKTNDIYLMKEKKAPPLKPVKAIILGLIVFVAIVFFNLINNGNLSEVAEMQERINMMDSKIAELKDENKQLKQKILSIEQDDFMIEKVARQELGLVKKDEIVYKILDTK